MAIQCLYRECKEAERCGGAEDPAAASGAEDEMNSGQDLPEAQELVSLYGEWRSSATREERRRIWKRMLEINAEQLFAIGVVNATLQPVVVSRKLKNVPQKGLYSFEPGAFFGRYMPDTFWFDTRKTVGLDKGRG